MSISTIIEKLPPDLRPVLAELIEVLIQRFDDRYAVRRVDFEQLLEAQARTEQRLTRLETAVTELAEAQARTEQRLTRLEMVVADLAEAQKRTESRVEELAEAQKRTEYSLGKVIVRQGENTGILLEMKYRDRAYAYFGTLLRKVQVVSMQDLETELESHLGPAEFQDLLLLDLLVRGQVRMADEPVELYLALEISAVVDIGDVERAQRRAGLLRKAGFRVVAAVAGEDATEGGVEMAQAATVLMVQNGSKLNWVEALADALVV